MRVNRLFVPPRAPSRSASSVGIGSTSNSFAGSESVTTVSLARLSISGRATPASTGVIRPIQSDERRGVSSGTGSFWAAAGAEHVRHQVLGAWE